MDAPGRLEALAARDRKMGPCQVRGSHGSRRRGATPRRRRNNPSVGSASYAQNWAPWTRPAWAPGASGVARR